MIIPKLHVSCTFASVSFEALIFNEEINNKTEFVSIFLCCNTCRIVDISIK